MNNRRSRIKITSNDDKKSNIRRNKGYRLYRDSKRVLDRAKRSLSRYKSDSSDIEKVKQAFVALATSVESIDVKSVDPDKLEALANVNNSIYDVAKALASFLSD